MSIKSPLLVYNHHAQLHLNFIIILRMRHKGKLKKISTIYVEKMIIIIISRVPHTYSLTHKLLIIITLHYLMTDRTCTAVNG